MTSQTLREREQRAVERPAARSARARARRPRSSVRPSKQRHREVQAPVLVALPGRGSGRRRDAGAGPRSAPRPGSAPAPRRLRSSPSRAPPRRGPSSRAAARARCPTRAGSTPIPPRATSPEQHVAAPRRASRRTSAELLAVGARDLRRLDLRLGSLARQRRRLASRSGCARQSSSSAASSSLGCCADVLREHAQRALLAQRDMAASVCRRLPSVKGDLRVLQLVLERLARLQAVGSIRAKSKWMAVRRRGAGPRSSTVTPGWRAGGLLLVLPQVVGERVDRHQEAVDEAVRDGVVDLLRAEVGARGSRARVRRRGACDRPRASRAASSPTSPPSRNPWHGRPSLVARQQDARAGSCWR